MSDTPQRHVDLIERCDCGSAHFVSVRYWRDDESWPEGYFEVVLADHCDEGLWARLRGAWRLVRQGYCQRNDLVLNEAKAARLIEALTPLARG